MTTEPHIVTDLSVSPGTIEFRDSDGNVTMRVTNVKAAGLSPVLEARANIDAARRSVMRLNGGNLDHPALEHLEIAWVLVGRE